MSEDAFLNDPTGPMSLPDIFLDQLLLFADLGVEAGLTVIVGGQFLCGALIGERKYYDLAAAQIEGKARSDDARATMASSIRTLAEAFPPPDKATGRIYSHLHLRDAFVFNWSGESTKTKGFMIRIPLSAVRGYVLGNFTKV